MFLVTDCFELESVSLTPSLLSHIYMPTVGSHVNFKNLNEQVQQYEQISTRDSTFAYRRAENEV